MRSFIILLLMFILKPALSQDAAHKLFLNFGLNLNVPDHEPLFRENFDGRPGAQIRISRHIENGISLGAGVETYTVRAITNNPNSFNVTRADFYAANFSIGYDVLKKNRSSIAPLIEAGATYINYDKGEPSNLAGHFGAGIRFLYFMENIYGLEIGLNYFTILSPFSPESFPENNNSMRFVMVRLGFTFDLSKIDLSD